MHEVTQKEWWVFLGIVAAASPEGAGGTQMFQASRNYRTATEPIDYGLRGQNIMAQYRFKEIKEAFPHAFDDHDAASESDPWHMISGFVAGFNKNRGEVVAASSTKVHDEGIAAHEPQSTKKGDLPNISYVKRKPQPLGTEFKIVCCSKTGAYDCVCVVFPQLK